MLRDSPFSYECQRCSRCCHHQAIQVNPYEILCLSRHLGLTTGQFIAQHTTNNGLFLRFTPQGACGFLNDQGCGVHPARPLVCRLYPLGREIDLAVGEGFGLLEPHPQCPAQVGREGQLADYLDEQGAIPFLEAADRYLEVVLEMHEILQQHAPGADDQAALAGPGQGGGPGANPWLDVDGVLGQAASHSDPWQAVQRHLAAIRQWIKNMDREERDGKQA